MKYLATLVATLMLLTVVGVAPATATPSAQAGQCEPGLYKVDTSDGSKVFPSGWTVCLKAGNGNTGPIVTDGVTTIAEYIEQSGLLNNGGQVPNISNYVVYSEREPVKRPAQQSVKIVCSNDPTQALVTYTYRTRTVDGVFQRQEWTRSITGLVFTAQTVSLKGEGQKTWLAPLGLDMRGTVTARFTLGNSEISKTRTLVCGEPKGPDQNAYIKHYGPKGDPWYRFTFFNPRDDAASNATCKVIFEGRDGTRVVKRKLVDGQGWKSPWMWVKGNTVVKEVCFEGGERAFTRTFRSAAPGYYGPLYRNYTIGYFVL